MRRAGRAANILCPSLAPEKTVRICLGIAFTNDTGQRALVRNAPRVIALEGCFVNCSSRMMNGAVEGLNPEVIHADRLYDFDRKLFGIEEMPSDREKLEAGCHFDRDEEDILVFDPKADPDCAK